MNYLSLFSLLLCTQLIAASSITKSLDLDKDGIKDRFEYYQGKKLIRLEEDRNNDKKIDFITIYNDSKYFKIEKQDTKNKGPFDRIVFYSIQDSNKVKIRTTKDSNGDGVFDIDFVNIQDTIQNQDPCVEEVNTQVKIDGLTDFSLKAAADLNEGFLPSGVGHKIDKACLQKWGNNFPEIVTNSVKTGLSCLRKLANNAPSKNGVPGVMRNLKDLEGLLEEDNISLVCSENDFGWSGSRAHASTTPTDTMTSPSVKHPFISLNPKYPTVKEAPTEKEVTDIQRTIFHEQIHNLGYSHGHGVEFAYSCASCCFADYGGDAGQKAACKVCTGDYKNTSDKDYLRDIVIFSNLTYNENVGQDASINYLKENPKNLFGISNLAKSSNSFFDPLGYHLAKVVKEKNHNLTLEDKATLESILSRAPTDGNLSANTLAQVTYQLYFEKDGNKAISILEQNKELLREEFKNLEAKKGNTNFVANNLKKSTSRVIYDVWINHFSENHSSVSDRAYQLHLFFQQE